MARRATRHGEGGGETKVDRSAAGAPRAAANEAADNQKALCIIWQRERPRTFEHLRVAKATAYGGGTLSPPPIFVFELAKSLSALVL